MALGPMEIIIIALVGLICLTVVVGLTVGLVFWATRGKEPRDPRREPPPLDPTKSPPD